MYLKKNFALSAAMLILLVFNDLISNLNAQYTIPAKMNWWYESRFGMFIHFGSYSYLAQGEWAMSNGYTKTTYQTNVSAKFNPTSFNAGTIARLAQKAGMKYLVITAKHHEGFCMWDTQVASFKDVTGTKDYDLPGFTAFKTRDILKELKDSCDAVGVKFCLYYSILDWNHPSQEILHGTSPDWYTYSTMASDSARTNYITDMKAQLKELIDKYHPAIMWFDGDWTYNYGAPTPTRWWTKADGADLYNYLTGLDPNLLVNERVFRSAGLGDWMCPEGVVPATPESRPWETCQTMNHSWGYNASDNNYKSTDTLIKQLVEIVSKDGNYLLNIGPKGNGTVPDQSAIILNGIGKWMDIYSGSIYGATRSPFSNVPSWGRFTKKDGKPYAHVFSWPSNGLLKVPSLINTINKIYLLNDTNILLNYKDSLGYITISVPATAPDTINSVVVIEVSGLPKELLKITAITLKGRKGVKQISPGDTLRIFATITPSKATYKSVTWSVSDSTIASIDKSGLLTAKKDGDVTVFAISNDGSGIQGNIVINISGQTNIKGRSIVTDKVSLFPVPVDHGVLNVKQILGSNVIIKIFDMNGKKMLEKRVDHDQIALDVSILVQGTYTFELSTKEQSVSQNILIK